MGLEEGGAAQDQPGTNWRASLWDTVRGQSETWVKNCPTPHTVSLVSLQATVQDQPGTNWRVSLWDSTLHLCTEVRHVRPPVGLGGGGAAQDQPGTNWRASLWDTVRG